MLIVLQSFTNCHFKINFFIFYFAFFIQFFSSVPCSSYTEAASGLVEGRYGHVNSKLIYGTFSTPTNAIAGSAVCAFSLQVSNSTISYLSFIRRFLRAQNFCSYNSEAFIEFSGKLKRVRSIKVWRALSSEHIGCNSISCAHFHYFHDVIIIWISNCNDQSFSRRRMEKFFARQREEEK